MNNNNLFAMESFESFSSTVLRIENRFVFQDTKYIKSEIRKVFNKKQEGIL